MVIVPHVSVGGLAFGANQEEAVARFGLPNRIALDDDCNAELHYDAFIVRFLAADGGFREFTTWPDARVVVGDTLLPWTAEAFVILRALGANLRAGHGFVVSPEHGLAFGDFDDERLSERTIHAFRRGEWDGVLAHMTDFAPDD